MTMMTNKFNVVTPSGAHIGIIEHTQAPAKHGAPLQILVVPNVPASALDGI